MNKRPVARYGAVALLFGFAVVTSIQNRMQGDGSGPSRTLRPTVAHAMPDGSQMRVKTTPIAVRSPYQYLQQIHPKSFPPVPPELIDEETLWLARCVFSETKRQEEQELIAWVVRNRVETGYRGKKTYRDTVLDRYQFSAFNADNPERSFFVGLRPTSEVPGWQVTLRIAYHVRRSEGAFRPFPIKTRHFYSERSLQDEQTRPAWASGRDPVTPARDYNIEDNRFRFFAGVS